MIAPETPPRGISRRAAIAKGVAIAAGVALLPIGGLAAFAAYEKSNDPLLFAIDEGNINAAAWSPDSTRVASAGLTGAQVWDAASGQRLLSMQTHESLDDIVWSADGKRLLTLQQKFLDVNGPNPSAFVETVEVWDAASGQRRQSLRLTEPGFTGYVQVGLNDPYLAVNREIRAEDVVVAGGQPPQGKVIEIWDVAAGRMIAAFSGFPGRYGYPSGQMFWAPDRRRLAVIYDEGISASVEVEILDAAARQRIASFAIPRPTNVPPPHPALPVAWAPDAQSFAVGLDIYSADTGLHRSHFHADGHPVETVAWSPDGRRLAVATVNRGPGLYAPATNTIFMLDPSDGRQLARYGAGGSLTGLDIAFSPNSRYFLVTTEGNVEVWRSG